MKKLGILAFLMCVFSSAYAQDLIKEIKNLILINDSLQKEISIIKSKNVILNKKIQFACDSTFEQMKVTHSAEILKFRDNNSKQNMEILKLHDQISNLKEDTASLIKQIKRLDKINIEKIKLQIKQKTDSLMALKDTIAYKNKYIILLGQESLKKESKKYTEGQQNVYDQIIKFYETNTFDVLVVSSSQKSIERDLQIIGNNNIAKQRLHNLQIYHNAKNILQNKFDVEKVKNIKNELMSIREQSTSLEILKISLEDYRECNTKLRETLDKIIKMDERLTAVDEDTQKIKMKDILFEITSYTKNYLYNVEEYPYLLGILLEVMNKKQKNANADIRYLLDKL